MLSVLSVRASRGATQNLAQTRKGKKTAGKDFRQNARKKDLNSTKITLKRPEFYKQKTLT